ncbi:hypothetical protein PF001_g29432 [Phytophthora fragariae]|uniref:Uncharacterized protein n=2 Tax=Phytophthora fragariae TaxID=53985 RepID=A0A6A4BD09_9STRA|nr:hypothetical protein PF001_g29432 [Phytophthora fragariae]
MEELDEGGSRQAELRLESHEVKRLIHEALSEKSFPPVVQYPEAARGDALLSSLFQWPVIVWVPECVNPTKKPYCIMPERSCTPRVKEYKQRTVEDVDSKCHLLYIKYQCASDSKSCFSTVTAGYIQREARLLMHFPFVMTKKFGISKSLMEMVHEGMTSPHGLSRTVENLQRRREKRYYKLLCLFADRVAQLQLSNPLYLAPTPPSVGQYCSTQKSVGAETLSAAWMQSTSIYSALCEQIMSSIEVKKVLRIDHSVKFCKRLKNEIGQIVGRRLTRSENHDETRQLLEHVKGAANTGNEWFLVSDNANAIRSLAADVYGEAANVRQDPFHVVQRFTEKVKGKAEKKLLSKKLHDAMYNVDGELRPPEEMAARFANALQEVSITDISCTEHEWRGSVDSNLKQIKRGDLYVKSNVFSEGGGKDVRIVSTSQLEGIHSALKKILARSVSAEVGLRILDLYILQHNLKVGSNYGRNPPLHHADILTLAQTAMLCRGVVAESPQLEFVSRLMSKPLLPPAYRSATALDFGFDQWQQMFDGTSIDTQALEGSLQRAHQHSATIRELLAKQIAFTESGRLPRAAFFNSLCLHELDYEAAAGFSGEKHALLRQVVTEQKAATQSWSDCSMVTTIMYNIVVSSNSNHRLNLKRRSFAALSPKIDGLATKKTPSSSDRKIFRIARATPCDENTPREKELQEQLFTALRKMAGIRKKRQIFAKVYDFACCVCAGIHPKAQSFLLSRWDNLKQKENYGANLKIKLKLTPRSWLPYAQQPIIKPHPN